ncbi:uncharacterized protein DC041_0002127, partial [Schistosoma bovis]
MDTFVFFLSFYPFRENVQISLNAKDYYNINYSNQSLSELGIVNGDIIYINSLEKLDDIKQSLETELATPILKFINDNLSNDQHYTSTLLMAIPLYIFAIEKGLYCSRSSYSKTINFTNKTLSYQARCHTPIVFLIGLERQTWFIRCIICLSSCLFLFITCIFSNNLLFVCLSSFVCMLNLATTNKLNLLYRHLRLLSIRIKDELIEPILLAIHSEYNLSPRLHLCTLP